MIEITPRVRVGFTRIGEANIEVFDRQWQDPDAEVEQIFVPQDAVERLGTILVKNG